MRNHTGTAAPASTYPAPDEQSATALARIGRAFGSIIEWLRAGYPDDAPRTGHSPLLALNGPMALSANQAARAAAELTGKCVDDIEIGAAITKVTNRLPTSEQKRSVTRALTHVHHTTSPDLQQVSYTHSGGAPSHRH